MAKHVNVEISCGGMLLWNAGEARNGNSGIGSTAEEW
jgi:hypothetical protein